MSDNDQPQIPNDGMGPMPNDPFSDDLVDLKTLAGRFDEKGWIPPKNKLSYEEWEYTFEAVRHHREMREHGVDAILWALGDVIVAGERWHSENHAQAFSELDYTDGAINNVSYTCRNISRGVRVHPSALSFWKHNEVASLPEPYQRKIITAAAANRWTRDEIRGVCRSVRKELEDKENPDTPTATESDSTPDGETCPLCDGKGRVHHDRAEAYLAGE